MQKWSISCSDPNVSAAPPMPPPPYAISKWFYNTFTGAVKGAVCCGSFVGDDLVLLTVSYR
jgi:hypothetical protein